MQEDRQRQIEESISLIRDLISKIVLNQEDNEYKEAIEDLSYAVFLLDAQRESLQGSLS